MCETLHFSERLLCETLHFSERLSLRPPHKTTEPRDFSRLCLYIARNYFFFDFFFLSDLLGTFFHFSVSDFNAYFSRAESVLLLFIRFITFFFSNGVFALLISIVICSYSDNVIESCTNDIVSMFFTSTESNDCAETSDVKQVVITANNILLIRFVFIIKKPRNIRGFPYIFFFRLLLLSLKSDAFINEGFSAFSSYCFYSYAILIIQCDSIT